MKASTLSCSGGSWEAGTAEQLRLGTSIHHDTERQKLCFFNAVDNTLFPLQKFPASLRKEGIKEGTLAAYDLPLLLWHERVGESAGGLGATV